MFNQERYRRAITKKGELLWMLTEHSPIMTRREIALIEFQKWELRKYLGNTNRQEINEDGH